MARRYAPEYRRQVVELVRTGRGAEELSREFGCSAQAIRNCVRRADVDEGRRAVFDLVEAFDNRKRRHSALGYLSPAAFERSRGPGGGVTLSRKLPSAEPRLADRTPPARLKRVTRTGRRRPVPNRPITPDSRGSRPNK